MVTGKVLVWLRMEGAAVLLLSVVLYGHAGGKWLTFALCFLLPDVSFATYAISRSLATHAYNAAHSYAGPVTLAVILLLLQRAGSAWWYAVFIWTAHIGFDRMLGYGLKYEGSFDDTHLGLIGKSAARAKRVAA